MDRYMRVLEWSLDRSKMLAARAGLAGPRRRFLYVLGVFVVILLMIVAGAMGVMQSYGALAALAIPETVADLVTADRNSALWTLVNRPIASHEGFSYSDALSEKKDQVWDYDHLNHFLTSPKSYAPGTKMSFAGISKDQERADVIAYLRSLSDNPAPLPGS